jgi:hypothetical protein
MAEFKKLSAVEAIEAVSDAASVLIEENGVIKRAPKGEVGGIKVASTAEVGQTIVVKAVDAAGNPTEWECADLGAGYDAVIDLGVFSDTTSLSDLTGGSVPAGTVKMIEGKIAAGEMPKLMGIIAYQYYDTMMKSIFEFTAVGTYGNNQVRCYCDIMPYAGHYSLYAYLRDDSGIDTCSVTKL